MNPEKLYEAATWTIDSQRFAKGTEIWEVMVGARGFEPPASWSRTRRSTRLSHAPTGGW
jgi:hypothetical protein